MTLASLCSKDRSSCTIFAVEKEKARWKVFIHFGVTAEEEVVEKIGDWSWGGTERENERWI